jgi:glycosyltransferase involved in cell wall biosynthesis
VAAVVPIFKSEDHISHVFRYLTRLSHAIPGGVEAYFVLDGSPDQSGERIREQSRNCRFKVNLIELSRNFGTVCAVHAGLKNVNHCVTIVFGSDLQEPEHLFIEFCDQIFSAKVDVCFGNRIARDDPFTTKIFSGAYWWIHRNFINNDTPRGGFDVFGISTRAREALVGMSELNSSLASQLQWIGFDRTYVPYKRTARISGKSTWSMRRKVKHFADSIYGFTGAPIALLILLGVFSLIAVGILSALTFVGWSFGWIELPGYTTLVLLIAFGQAINITGLGILGGYLFRTFENSKGRPQYIVKSVDADIAQSVKDIN